MDLIGDEVIEEDDSVLEITYVGDIDSICFISRKGELVLYYLLDGEVFIFFVTKVLGRSCWFASSWVFIHGLES